MNFRLTLARTVRTALPVRLVLLDHRGPLDQPVQPVYRGRKASQDLRVQRDPRGHPGQRGRLGHPGRRSTRRSPRTALRSSLKDPPARPVHRVRRAPGCPAHPAPPVLQALEATSVPQGPPARPAQLAIGVWRALQVLLGLSARRVHREGKAHPGPRDRQAHKETRATKGLPESRASRGPRALPVHKDPRVRMRSCQRTQLHL